MNNTSRGQFRLARLPRSYPFLLDLLGIILLEITVNTFVQSLELQIALGVILGVLALLKELLYQRKVEGLERDVDSTETEFLKGLFGAKYKGVYIGQDNDEELQGLAAPDGRSKDWSSLFTELSKAGEPVAYEEPIPDEASLKIVSNSEESQIVTVHGGTWIPNLLGQLEWGVVKTKSVRILAFSLWSESWPFFHTHGKFGTARKSTPTAFKESYDLLLFWKRELVKKGVNIEIRLYDRLPTLKCTIGESEDAGANFILSPLLGGGHGRMTPLYRTHDSWAIAVLKNMFEEVWNDSTPLPEDLDTIVDWPSCDECPDSANVARTA